MFTVKSLRKHIRNVIGVAGYIIQYGCIAHCTLEFVGEFVVCKGPSMEPTIYSDDILITEHISTRMNLLNRGDIVIARSPSDPHQHICKRVVALSGDRIKKGLWSQTVPKGHVWLEGDNDNYSTDSRSYGAVPQGLIRGRAIYRIWPFAEFGSLSSCAKIQAQS